jgi:uncharacterized protein YbjT (DUF2867 family)
MKERFLVLGASGLVGGLVWQHLLQDGLDAWGATRRPVSERHVALDLLEPASFAAALRGVTTVMLVSRPGDEDAHRLAQPFVEAMRQAGVSRVVVLSALGAERRPEFSLRKVEQLVEESGLAWTHVRPNFFMQMLALPPLSCEIAGRGTLSLPLDDAAVAYVDAHDVAAVVHRAWVDASLSGRALAVNGPRAWSHEQLMEVLSSALGRELRYVPLSEDAARELMTARGLQPRQAQRVLAFYRLIRAGFCEAADDAVAALLSRPLSRWEGFVERQRAAWPQAVN